MEKKPLLERVIPRKRREQLGMHLRIDGSVTIRQGRHRVHLSHSDALLLLQLKGMQG